MLAYKFLDSGGCTVITGSRWPRPDGDEPGPWVEASSVRPCREGVHACRGPDLAYWISDQLWEIELDGEIVDTHHKVVGQRGRLVRRITEWSPACASEMGAWGAWRSRDLAETILRDGEQEDLAGEIGESSTLAELAATGARIADALDDGDAGGAAAGYAADVARLTLAPSYAEATFVAACAAAHAAALDGNLATFDAAFAEERRIQSAWMVERLALT
jgi:hypothetical protein